MNETLQTIHARYTCRAYTNQVPSHEDLIAIANAALTSPSAMNRQPWHFILVKNPQLIADLEAAGLAKIKADPDQNAWERLRARGGTLFYGAPCMLVIASQNSAVDCGIATQTAALAAASLGINSCICGLAGMCYNDELAARVGIPEGYTHGLTLLLGYAEKNGTPREIDPTKLNIVE
ncbi:MAG: nitroreductase family protein [Oscillospiraceae bacterium]|nr:nitroreductase family protein [Oscillospiraceae bacterium]